IYQAISELIQLQGGIVVVDEQKTTSLAFPLGGLMANSTCDFVAHKQHELIQHLKALNCPLASPIVALGFMQLVVIPELKITDRGLFDVNEFRYIG
ncbi:MAG: adenine deaminase, partial [Bacteroidales bacterium]|nr:adenine deaminase [Bacteroidales bacterium]